MAFPLLELPHDLRKRIYDYALCTQGAAALIQPDFRKQKTPGSNRYERGRFHYDALEPIYPPGKGEVTGEGKVSRGPDQQAEAPTDHYMSGDEDSQEDESDWSDVSEEDSEGDEINVVEQVEDAEQVEDVEDQVAGRNGKASKRLPFKHLLVSQTGPVGTWDLWRYGLFSTNGKLSMGPNPEDDDYDDEEDEEDEMNDEPYLDRFGYKLTALRRLDTSLLLVNRQINKEAAPVFYAGTNFLPSCCDTASAMRFFMTLPSPARHSITTLTTTSELLMGDDGATRECWSGNKALTSGSPAMFTPFGAFLATEMPSLTDVFLYTPIYGTEDWYCPWAPIELCKLLCHGRLKRLHYVFLGKKVGEALRTMPTSQKCFDRIFDPIGQATARHEFLLAPP